MEKEILTPEQLKEVNARVIQILDTFREGLYNSAAFDYANYWRLCMEGDGRMSEACKHVYETKERVMSFLDKETEMVLIEEESLYYKKQREAKEKIISSMLGILEPALKGRDSRGEEHYTFRAARLAEFALGKGEELGEFRYKNKFLKKNI